MNVLNFAWNVIRGLTLFAGRQQVDWQTRNYRGERHHHGRLVRNGKSHLSDDFTRDVLIAFRGDHAECTANEQNKLTSLRWTIEQPTAVATWFTFIHYAKTLIGYRCYVSQLHSSDRTEWVRAANTITFTQPTHACSLPKTPIHHSHRIAVLYSNRMIDTRDSPTSCDSAS